MIELMHPGRSFGRYIPFVGTTLFHWYVAGEGQRSGPWRPVEGREGWTGEPEFWIRQIKQMMMANIDAVYVHCINHFEPQRINFFTACNQLRQEGWDIPKVAPFLDPFYLWRDAPIDVGTPEGRQEFIRHYIRFFDQYFSQNYDELAHTYLLHVDDKLVLTSWWAYSLLKHLDKLTREYVERTLCDALGNRIPSLRRGIYMISTALIDPDYSFSDERMVMFSGYTYALHCVYNTVDSWHVQPGYWDQNLQKPGYLMPRDGGVNYRRAWEVVASKVDFLHRVYVESWNEYNEGSGIYAADPGPPFVAPDLAGNTDLFSTSNDPFEYINTTARGASLVNRLPEDNAVFISLKAPAAVAPGSQFEIEIVVRNEGNARWTGASGYALRVSPNRIVPIDDKADEIPLYGGIFRGRPLRFRVKVPTGHQLGPIVTELSMVKHGVPFGSPAIARVEIR